MKLYALLFKEHHPELTEDQIEDLYERASEIYGDGHLENLLAETQGVIPEDESSKEKRALQEMGALAQDQPEKKD